MIVFQRDFMRRNIKHIEEIKEPGYIIPLYLGKKNSKTYPFLVDLSANGSSNYIIKSFIREGEHE